jgi:hypothetical protein
MFIHHPLRRLYQSGGNGRTSDPTNLNLQPHGTNLRIQDVEPVNQGGQKGELKLLKERRGTMTGRADTQK